MVLTRARRRVTERPARSRKRPASCCFWRAQKARAHPLGEYFPRQTGAALNWRAGRPAARPKSWAKGPESVPARLAPASLGQDGPDPSRSTPRKRPETRTGPAPKFFFHAPVGHEGPDKYGDRPEFPKGITPRVIRQADCMLRSLARPRLIFSCLCVAQLSQMR